MKCSWYNHYILIFIFTLLNCEPYSSLMNGIKVGFKFQKKIESSSALLNSLRATNYDGVNDLNSNNDVDEQESIFSSSFAAECNCNTLQDKEGKEFESAYEEDDPRLYRLKGNINSIGLKIPKGMNPHITAKEQQIYDELMSMKGQEKDNEPEKTDLELLKESLRQLGERMELDFKSPTDIDPPDN